MMNALLKHETTGSGNDIGQQLAADFLYMILEHQFAFFQALHLQEINRLAAFKQPVDRVIKITMLELQLGKFFTQLLFVVHIT